MDVAGAAAVVTGGASGLGAATARALAAHGAAVVIVDLQRELGEALAEEIGGTYVRADVTREDDVIAAVDAAVQHGPLRALVNCAGIASPRRTIGRDGAYASAHPLDDFARVIAVNLVGTFNCIRLAASAISRTEPLADGARGAIVNTASLAAFEGQVGQAAYSASKGGIVGMTLPIARDLAVVGIRVNTIAPGSMQTPIFDQVPGPEAMKAALQRDVVFPRRLGRPEEFASLAMVLIANDYMNGEVVRIDGAARLPPR